MAQSSRAERRRKYQPLGEYLAALPRSTAQATLSFADVERIIDDELPHSAHEHREWVGGPGLSAPYWRAAGFKVDMGGSQA